MIGTLAPFGAEFAALSHAADRLLGEAAGSPYRTPWSRAGGAPTAQPMPLDVYATQDEAVVVAAVPGMRPEDLEVAAHQNTVTLSGTVPNPAGPDGAGGATWYLRELWSGRFHRSVTLPFEVDASRATASFEGGIVRVALPKAERARPRKIAVRVAGGPRTEAIGPGDGQDQEQAQHRAPQEGQEQR